MSAVERIAPLLSGGAYSQLTVLSVFYIKGVNSFFVYQSNPQCFGHHNLLIIKLHINGYCITGIGLLPDVRKPKTMNTIDEYLTDGRPLCINDVVFILML